jgi:Zn-dependent protease with chaperone function
VATTALPARQRPVERLMPSGTNARFALVIVLALITSAKMVLEFAYSFSARQSVLCDLAAGIDVYRVDSDVSALSDRFTQAAAWTNCEARLATPPPWWLPTGWLLLVLVVAVFAFYADSWWKTRGSRARPIGEFDGQGNGFVISGEVLGLAMQAGLTWDAGVSVIRRCVVDVTSTARSAAVLGSNRNPILCLHIGLVAGRLELASEGKDDPEFKAVLLHEFAHIRSGDVTAARGAMAVWRGFLLVALLPYLVIAAILTAHGTVAGEQAGNSVVDQRDLLVTLVLACLGYLARSDVLRIREIYADREAVDNGADKCQWHDDNRDNLTRAGRAARAFAELWRSHPSWGLRADSVDDPVALFTVQALPVFLAGVAAALIDADFQYALQAYGQRSTWIGSQWMWQGTGALSAVLVTLIAGVALWRLVAYERRPRRAATGLRTGLWLGAGMITGDLAAGQGTFDHFVPSRPELLLLVLAAGAGFGWWTVQCAGVWLARRDRIPRWGMAIGLAGGFLILSWWFTWWADAGDPYSTGISISPSGYRLFLAYTFAGPTVHPAVLTVISWLGFVLTQLGLPPAVLLAVSAAWMVPMLAWIRLPRNDADGLPSLRTLVAWVTVGAAATWACVIWAQAYMHETQPSRPPLHGLYELTYSWFIIGAQVVPAAAVALAVGLRRGRFRLLTTLTAVEITVLAGFAGTFVLFSADGCARPLDTLETSCSWRPGLIGWVYSAELDIVPVLTALLTFAICALALARPAVRRGFRAGLTATGVRSATARALALTGIAGTAALGIALVGIVTQFPLQSHYVSAANQVSVQVGYELSLPASSAAPPPIPEVAALEVEEWSDLGGAALLNRLQSDAVKISPVLDADFTRQHKYTVQDFQAVEPVCADIVAVAQQSTGYFLVPDNQARPWWYAFANLSRTGGRGCESAIALLPRNHFNTAFWTAWNRSMQQIDQAYINTGFIAARIEALEEAGGITGYGNGIAGPPLDVMPPPAGTRRWPQADDTGNPMNLPVAVTRLDSRSDWNSRETWLAGHGFVSTAREGWTYADGTQAAVVINRFADDSGATSETDGWDAGFRKESAPAPALTDPADGGMGVAIPASKQTPYVTTEMAARLGFYAIEVQVYARGSAPAIAKALLSQQYARLKAIGA